MIYQLEIEGRRIELADLKKLDKTLKIDVAYARADNFIGRKVYTQPCAFLLKHVADDLLKVHYSIRPHGLGLCIFDGYRPWSITKLFWDESSEAVRPFLADPKSGSSHNRACAVDLTLYRLSNGEVLQMPSGFDEMNEKAFVNYEGGTAQSRRFRDLLQHHMNLYGFTGIKNEWWHFNHLTNFNWPVMDLTFEEILRAPQIQHPLLKR